MNKKRNTNGNFAKIKRNFIFMLEYQQYEKKNGAETDEKIGIIGAMELEVETLKSINWANIPFI